MTEDTARVIAESRPRRARSSHLRPSRLNSFSWTLAGVVAPAVGQEALEIADKLRRRSMQQYKDPFISPESTRSSERKTWPSSGCRRPANHSPAMLSIHQGPDYDRLRSDPRFQDLIHR